MTRFISRNILTGLVTVLPVVLTLYLLYWLVVSAESALGSMLRLLLPDNLYRPGMGSAAGLIVVFFVGLLMHAYVVQRIFAGIERLLFRMPLIKTVYGAIRDFFDYFSPNSKKEFERVVAVTLSESGMQIIGFVTQTAADQMPKGFARGDEVLVYLPMSYMIGGYAVLMPQNMIRTLDMSMEEAMRFILTAGVTGKPTQVPAGV